MDHAESTVDLDVASTFRVSCLRTEEAKPDWPIQQIAALAGTTSRALRHYDTVGLLAPSRIAVNRYRQYNQQALVRLQRILLLRELGLGLPAIASVLAQESSATAALRTHVAWLRGEQDRLSRLVASVEKTIEAETHGEKIMTKDMLDGFDHTQQKEEVEQPWGKAAYTQGDVWWRGMDAAGQSAWKSKVAALNADWLNAHTGGTLAGSGAGQAPAPAAPA